MLWLIALEITAILIIEMVLQDMRWHAQNPELSAELARIHEEQDRREGRYD